MWKFTHPSHIKVFDWCKFFLHDQTMQELMLFRPYLAQQKYGNSPLILVTPTFAMIDAAVDFTGYDNIFKHGGPEFEKHHQTNLGDSC